MHKTVEEFFRKEYPLLTASLNNEGGFWPNVKDNTVSNKQLASTVYTYIVMKDLRNRGAVYNASILLLCGRLLGLVPNPDSNVNK